MEQFYVRLNLRLDWSELDLLNHINNVAYFKYIQAARINYWEACGFDPYFNKSDIGPILLSTNCKFIRPLFYPGSITIESRIEFIKNTSYGIHHRILNDHNEIVAEAHDVIVNYNFKTNEKVAVSDDFRAKVECIESGKMTTE